MLEDLTDTFNQAQVEALRLSIGKNKNGTSQQIRNWRDRGFITFDETTGLYAKTEAYLNRGK